MGHAILNRLIDRLIGLVNKTLNMSFFQENFYFHNFSWVLDQWRPKNRTSLKEDSNWLDILKPCFKGLKQLLKVKKLDVENRPSTD